ncbi:MAG: ABC transporter ATP-binding protein/permease [Deinococcota bacterium]|nr:ABC transporter ATP-binding protein/permease [Deinococcota bacterium]
MAVKSVSSSEAKREFSVADAHSYDHSSPLRWVLSHLLRYKLLLAAFLAASLLTSVLFSAVPRLTGLAFDEVLQAGASAQRLFVIAAIILGIVLLRGVVDLVNSFSVETLGQRLERDARDELYLSLLGKSQTFHNRQRVGDIMARASNDVRQLNPMMNPGVALITESLIGLVVPLVFIATIRLELLLAPVLFVVAFVFALRHYMRQLSPVSTAMRRQFGVMNAGLNETVTGIEVVKSVVQEAQEKRKFVRDAGLYRDYFIKQGHIQARYLPLLLLGFALTGAFAHGLVLLARGEISTGQLVAYMGLMGILQFPAFISIFTFSLVQLGLAGAERILELIREETELDENPAGYAAPIRGEIVFDGVSFGFGGAPLRGAPLRGAGKMALRGLSFRTEPGQTVAIVGQTGSGKSTLTKLVNRAYDVSEGRILIDGVDVRDWNLESLRSQISVIEQDVFLFSRSIADNIAFGLGQKATPEAIESAAKAAQAHDFIRGFADGYDTVIGERGVTLSGGQRQRLAIARALLTDPRILILDDSTSAIDSATEDAIQRAINRVLEGRTTLMITHRLSQIRRADKILVLHQGEPIDQGKHEELLERCGLYGRIFARYD